MRLRRRHVVATLLLLFATAFYGYFLYRAEITQQAHGWNMRFSYLPFHCRVCRGRVEELTYHGAGVQQPTWAWNEHAEGGSPTVTLHTPVGTFCAIKRETNWRMAHGPPFQIEDAVDDISPAEIAQGWSYAKSSSKEYYPTYGPFIRKRGMPNDWCLVATTNAARWIAPEKIDTVPW